MVKSYRLGHFELLKQNFDPATMPEVRKTIDSFGSDWRLPKFNECVYLQDLCRPLGVGKFKLPKSRNKAEWYWTDDFISKEEGWDLPGAVKEIVTYPALWTFRPEGLSDLDEHISYSYRPDEQKNRFLLVRDLPL